MNRLFVIILLLNSCYNGFGQSLEKYQLGDSGCSAYFFCDPGTFDKNYSPDSSIVYTAECTDELMNYGIICVAFTNAIPDILEAEDVLVSYMDYLKDALGITTSMGYGYGHLLQEREDTRGVLDYWTDAEENNWKVKGWTDGRYLGILFAYTQDEIAEEPVNVYLDGFRLPGME